jgi:NTP pyrophosphatase (non-canonical NTP hydrolase)
MLTKEQQKAIARDHRFIIDDINDVAQSIHIVAVKKGFWDFGENASQVRVAEDLIPAKLMLVVTELAEAMEAYRDDNKENFEEEIADTFIRLLDLCGAFGINIREEICKKMMKNIKRPYQHGRKKGV